MPSATRQKSGSTAIAVLAGWFAFNVFGLGIVVLLSSNRFVTAGVVSLTCGVIAGRASLPALKYDPLPPLFILQCGCTTLIPPLWLGIQSSPKQFEDQEFFRKAMTAFGLSAVCWAGMVFLMIRYMRSRVTESDA